MSARGAALLAVVLAIGSGASSCGGGDDGDTARMPSEPAAQVIPAGVVSRADDNCRWMLHSVKRLARSVDLSDYSSGLELTTEGFAKPGMKLIENLERRQRALQAAADDPRFDAYLALFDPIVVLGEQRLEAGLAGQEARSKHLQDLLTDLGAEQREAAAKAGLVACDVDFFEVLLRQAFG